MIRANLLPAKDICCPRRRSGELALAALLSNKVLTGMSFL